MLNLNLSDYKWLPKGTLIWTRVFLVPCITWLSPKLFCPCEEYALRGNGIYSWKYTLKQTLNTSHRVWFVHMCVSFWPFSCRNGDILVVLIRKCLWLITMKALCYRLGKLKVEAQLREGREWAGERKCKKKGKWTGKLWI